MQSRRLLCRRQASEYLAAQHGLDISPEQLARWAVKGGGPPFHLLAGRIGKVAQSQGARNEHDAQGSQR